MKATKLLENQHKEVRSLFQKIESRSESSDPTDLFEQLARNLFAHDAIEREIFYPACEEVPGVTDLLGESLVEHGVVEFSLYQADISLGEEAFDYKCKVLKEMVEHHLDEEEKELLPKVESAMEDEELEQLGAQMEARFEEAKQMDFRGPLLENLQKVLTGAIKTDDTEEEEEEGGAATKKKSARSTRSSSRSNSPNHSPRAR